MNEPLNTVDKGQGLNVRICAPELMPLGGIRPLSLKAMARRDKALNCIRGNKDGQCQGQVYINLFFDGTENNQDWKQKGLDGRTQRQCGKHSNIARLYNARIDDTDHGFFSYYIPGIGTPFKEIGDNGGALGSGFAYKGADRINWGITRVFNAVNFYVTKANLLGDGVAGALANQVSRTLSLRGFEAIARKNAFNELEAKLAKNIKGRTPVVTSINLAVFGFSRGAATARAFANWLFEFLEKEQGGGYSLAGIPLRIGFMGLFDTVASVGMPDSVTGADGHAGWADNNMHISPAVEQCVHFVAVHEQRASFPLEVADNIKQVGYPGMHADIGGAYRPGEQGKTLQLSQITLMDMHHEAFKAGVPLYSIEEIRSKPALRLLRPDFECPDELIKAFNAYLNDCGINGNTSGKDEVDEILRAHTRQYLQWRKTMNVERLKKRPFYQRATLGVDQEHLRDGVEDFHETLKAKRENREVRIESAERNKVIDSFGSLPVRPRKHEPPTENPHAAEILRALDKDVRVPEAVCQLMEDYVHDSRAGFRPLNDDWLEVGDGYLRYRMVYQNGWHKREVVEQLKAAIPLLTIGSRKAAGS